LDKHILGILGGEDVVRAKHPEWFVSTKHSALAYRLVIEPSKELDYYIPMPIKLPNYRDNNRQGNLIDFYSQEMNLEVKVLAPSPYFGNSDKVKFKYKSDVIDVEKSKIEELRIAIQEKQSIGIHIYSLSKELIDTIQDYFNSFWVGHNFGTRQNKGFGCYQPIDLEDEHIVEELNKHPDITGIFRVSQGGSSAKKFEYINDIYGKLKRGVNLNNNYSKSLLWDYLKIKKSYNWEKRKIKEFLIKQDRRLFDSLKYETHVHRVETNELPDDNYYYIRALLGLAENYEFRKSERGKLVVKISDSSKGDSNYKDSIERFKSPIRFYCTPRNIYITTTDIPDELINQRDNQGNISRREFKFSVSELRRNSDFTLQIPEGFDVADFISYTNLFGPNLITNS